MKRLLFYTLFVTVCRLEANEPLPIDSLWQSEAFRKAYTASYGIDSQIEPLINEDESFYLAEAAKLMQAGDRPAAIQQILQSDISEESPALLFSLGNFQYEEGNLEVAISYFEDALKLFPNFRDAHRNVAMLKIQTDDIDDAEKHLKRAIELGSQEGLTYGLIAWCHTQKGRLQAALSAYRMAQVTMPEEVQWQLGEAYTLQSLGEAGKASSIYKTLIKKSPTDISLWINQANAYYSKQDYINAIGHLEVANRMGVLKPQNYFLLGQLYLEQSLPETALKNFSKAISDKAINLEAAVNCLGHFAAHQNWQEAEEYGKEFFTIYFEEIELPENSNLYSKYQRAMAMIELELGDAKSGAERIGELLVKDPLDGEALLLLANFRETNNQPEEAIVLLEQAAVIPEKRSEALLAHGRILVSQFQYKEALEKLEESQKIQPSVSLKKYIEAIQELM